MSTLLIVMPFALSALVKLLSVALLPNVMRRSLEDLAMLPGANQTHTYLGNDQRRLIVNAVGNSALKATATLTSLVSAFNAFVAVLSVRPSAGRVVALTGGTALLLVLLAWMFPQSPQELSERGLFNIERATIIALVLCGLDGLGAFLSVMGRP